METVAARAVRAVAGSDLLDERERSPGEQFDTRQQIQNIRLVLRSLSWLAVWVLLRSPAVCLELFVRLLHER